MVQRGLKNERRRTGFAHLFEHMMFQGSKNACEDYFTVEPPAPTCREGGVNGTTNQDRTNYFATVPSGNLENILGARVGPARHAARRDDRSKLDNQRDVVERTAPQGLENTPYGRWFKLAVENVFPAASLRERVIGSHEDLAAASLDDVSEFFRRYYTPNNLSLVIAGDFDPAEPQAAGREVTSEPSRRPRARSAGALDPEARWRADRRGQDRVPQERDLHGLALRRLFRG